MGRVATTDAIDRNFGEYVPDERYVDNTSAYMLVYIREDCKSRRTLCDIRRREMRSFR